jgi:hypothetical protein
MISLDKTGGRTVHLFIPFEHNKKKIESITLAPLRFGHALRWSEGAWKSMVELLVELSGVEQAIIHELRYPDADRVMEAFMSMLTPEIRDDIANGRIPLKAETYDAEAEEPRATNGRGGEPMVALVPGVPLPPEYDTQPGFDMSEEP